VKGLIWFGLGAASAVYASRRLHRAARRLTPLGLREQAAALGAGIRCLRAEVKTGMAEREAELRGSLGLDRGSPQGRELPAARSAPAPYRASA
jgi:uncharacterized protein DUF6167